MGSFLDLLVVPGAVIGLVLGIVLATLFHWLAPAGTDTASAATWLIAGGWVIGLLWSGIFGKRQK